MIALRETAAAKINLSLRVLGRRADGYHELRSLVAFADLGDTLEFVPGEDLSLTLDGPLAAALQQDDPTGNLILRAARTLEERAPGLRLGAFRLVKRLPVAAGLGGGSADAAATLRLLLRANPDLPPAMAQALCAGLGADVPVCFVSRASMVAGLGERVEPLASFPGLFAVLVNPGQALSTADVFAALAAPPLGEARDETPPAGFADGDALMAWLQGQGNDLQAPALRIAPVIADVLAALEACAGCRLARMSGSGATCFGLFDTQAEAATAADAIARAQVHWWTASTRLH